MKVLVAEDDIVNRIIIRKLLDSAGIEVVLVENGQQLLERYRSENWDLVLTDRYMPVIDGLEAARQIRELESNDGGKSIPIACVTADDEVPDTGSSSPFDIIIRKPLTQQSLLQAIRCLVNPEDRVSRHTDSTAETGKEFLDRKLVDEVKAEFGADAPEFFSTFLLDARRQLQNALTDIGNNDRSSLFTTAHTLKGASMNAGATGMAVLCKRLEGMAVSGAEQEIGGIIDELHAELDRVSGVLDKIITS